MKTAERPKRAPAPTKEEARLRAARKCINAIRKRTREALQATEMLQVMLAPLLARMRGIANDPTDTPLCRDQGKELK